VDGSEQLKTERRGGLLSRLRPGDSEPRDGIDALTRTVKGYNPKANLN
jgi:hypothetical protein